MHTYTHTVTVTKKDGTAKAVDSPYTDKEAMIRLYELTGFCRSGPPGRELIWTGSLTSSFARSLVVQNEMHGRPLSSKQWAWVHILVVEAASEVQS